jgi:coiled-coil and C2 domain-containing protein 2A
MIQEYNFASEEDIEKNKRYRLIMLRAQNEPEFRGYRMIPINERSVRKDQFDIYEKRKIKDLAGDDEEEKTNDTIRSGKFKDMENEIEMSRARGQKIVRRIREQILKQFKFTQSQKTLSDMIIEEQVPNIKLEFLINFL